MQNPDSGTQIAAAPECPPALRLSFLVLRYVAATLHSGNKSCIGVRHLRWALRVTGNVRWR
jgi:hypothetical protein